MKKFYFLLSGVLFASLLYGQRPDSKNRFPLTSDMPEWAQKLYRDDNNLNVLELDAAFEPWRIRFDSLKVAVNLAGENAGYALQEEFLYYKKYYKYYTRWRARVYPYMKEDGSLDFSITTDKDIKWANEQSTESATSSWSFLGPVITRWAKNDDSAQPPAPWQVNIYCIDVAPSDANTLYVGSETGVVCKTTDQGVNWTMTGADYFTNNIGAIAIHPTDPNIVYVSEKSDRIATTSNGGASWSTALTISGFNCEDIKIKPDEPEVVLAAGASLQRRAVGNVWTNVLNKKAYDIAFKPDNPSIAYVLVENATLDLCEFWKSTDGGLTWTIKSSGWITGLTDGGARMAVTPANPNRIYCVLLTGDGPRIMRSDDAGENWTIIASSSQTGLIGPCTNGPLSMTNGQGFFDLSIVASHTNADHVIVGTTTSFKSTDGGVNWNTMGGYCGSFKIHPDIQEAIAKGNDTWIVTDGGINLSTDFFTDPTYGVNYFVRTNNLRGSEHWGFDIGWNENVLVGGRYHDGNTAWRESYPAGDFLRMGGGEAPTGYVNPGNSSMTYFSDLGGRILPLNNNQNYSTFSVTKWPNESFYPMEGAEQKWDPRYMYTYYLGNGNQFWKTTDNGLTFTALYTHSSPTAEIRYIEVSRSNPDVIYFTVNVTSPSNDGELWKTTDGGLNWTKCNNPGTLTASQRRLSKITMSGTDANTIWWVFRTGPNGQKIFKSTDGGTSWTNWTTSTLDNLSATDVLHQLGTDGGVYFVTGSGGKIYYRDNTASNWTAYNTNLPLNLYGDFGGVFAKAYYKGGKLRLGTGNGIWEADLYTPSTTTLPQPMVDNPSPGCSRDTLQLESYSVINGAATYQWAISPAPQWISNANIRNPRLVLGTTAGMYSATLTVTDANGVSSKTVNNFINNLAGGDLCSADTLPGKSLSLDGSGDYASANGNLNLNSNTVSFTAWIKRNGAQSDFAGIVFARGSNTASGISISSTNRLRLHWNNNGWSNNPNLIVPDNVWTHVALVITPTNATLYMNGTGVTYSLTNTNEEFDTPIRIGSDAFGGRDFKGQIDEVTIWNKSLTQNEIRELMRLTQIPSTQPNLVAYYQFNETSGKTYDKVGTKHASLVGNATRVASTGPFGGGKSARVNVVTPGLKDFTGTGVKLAFSNTCPLPNGDVVVSRINLAPYGAPCNSTYSSDNHYWVIDNYGTNQTIEALDSARFENILVPATNIIPAKGYILNRRGINSDVPTWYGQPGMSTGVTTGPNGRISFGTGSQITQFGPIPTNVNNLTDFGQFIITDTIITGPDTVCTAENVTLNAGPGFSSYNWSDGGGTGQSATFTNLAATTNFTVTVTGASGCQLIPVKTVVAIPAPGNLTITPTNPTICLGSNTMLAASSELAGTPKLLGTCCSVTTGNTTSSTLGPNPLQNYYGGTKQQMLFTAAELTSLGMVNGSKISGIAINLSTANTTLPLQSLRVKVQSTALTALSTFVTSGWTTVRNPANYTPIVGWNTLNFDSGIYYTWDGTSNLLVEINYSNNNAGGPSPYNTACYSSVGASVVTLFYRSDSKTASAMDTYSGAASYTYTSRNSVQFTIANPPIYSWSPATGLNTTTGQLVTASPTSTTTYTVTASNGACFTTQSTTVTVGPAIPVITGPSEVASGGSATLDAGAGYTMYAWSNSGGNSQTATYTNITSTTTYTVTVTDGNGCTATATHTVTVSPLPVELVRFHARRQGPNNALLSWQTASEINLNGYEIEMSGSDGVFKNRGFVKGLGATSYEFTVYNLPPGQYYFRLKIIDQDGSFKYSQVRALVIGDANTRVNIYPNPSQDGVFQIDLADPSVEQIQVEIVNTIGQVLTATQLVNAGGTVQIQIPTEGVYTVHILFDDGTRVAKRVMVLR